MLEIILNIENQMKLVYESGLGFFQDSGKSWKNRKKLEAIEETNWKQKFSKLKYINYLKN